MYYNFKKYKIQHFSEEIEIEGQQFASYVKITLQNQFNHPITSFIRGVISMGDILEQYQEKQNIILDNGYVTNFDVSKIIKKLGINQLEIKQLSAQNCFFNSQKELNFSKIKLTQKELNFSYAYILQGKLNFHASTLAQETNDFSNIVFNSGDIEFDNVQFGTKINSFKNSVFKNGFKNFQYSDFSTGEANFTNVSFGDGDVSFINANFTNSKPTFKISSFEKGKVDFHYAHFGNKNISFERVEFGEGPVDFSKIEFGTGKLNFNRSIFIKGDINFEGIDLKNGKLTFKRVKFIDNYINFSEADCSGSSLLFASAFLGHSTFSFKKTIADSISFQSCHLNNYVDFRVKEVNNIDLSDCVVRDILDFIPYDHSVKINTLDLNGMRLIGKIFLDWEKNNVFQLIHNQENTSGVEKGYQFRLLKENFHNTGEYEAEDHAYIFFKRYESKSILQNDLKKSIWNKLWAYPNYYFKDLLLDKAGLYATAPVRVLWSMLITYIFFSILLVATAILKIGDLTGSNSHSILSCISDSFYFSIITYLTVGYGDFCPLGIDRWIAGIEGFVGVFLMAYFTVAFVRKILR